jgi:hypothetical protein
MKGILMFILFVLVVVCWGVMRGRPQETYRGEGEKGLRFAPKITKRIYDVDTGEILGEKEIRI